MQKKLEAELISIAHRILKLKNKSELDQLYLETGKLYEKLAVLKFLETHFSEAKPTIGHAEVSDKLAVIFDAPETAEETAVMPESDAQNETKIEDNSEVELPQEAPEEEVSSESESENEENVETETEIEESEVEEVTEEATTIDAEAEATDEEHEVQEELEVATETEEKEDDFKPAFEPSFEKKDSGKESKEDREPTDAKKAPQQISFEDLLGGHDYSDDIFEKVGEKKEAEIPSEKEPQAELIPAEKPEPVETIKPSMDIDKSEYEKPIAASLGKSISFGLNDRIGFEKNLFGGSSEDMNRVVSQLNTFNTFQEAQDFIEDMVKPDYNNWDNKDDYAQRFMDIVEKKFS